MTAPFLSQNSEAGILARLIQNRPGALSREAAEYLLSLRFDSGDAERMNFLSERAQTGSLSQEEAAELDSYIHVGNLLAVMQSRARGALRTLEDNAA